MRLTDHRYVQERHRMEVALRMIRLEARTCTIRACTGLTEDRIRNLFRSYVAPGQDGPSRRRRGKSPQQVTCFTRSGPSLLAASILAGVFASCGLLDSRSNSFAPTLAVGELMCDAYQFYRELDPGKLFSFEHAWFLLKSLHSGEELSLVSCARCMSLSIHERWMVQAADCPLCRGKSTHAGIADGDTAHSGIGPCCWVK